MSVRIVLPVRQTTREVHLDDINQQTSNNPHIVEIICTTNGCFQALIEFSTSDDTVRQQVVPVAAPFKSTSATYEHLQSLNPHQRTQQFLRQYYCRIRSPSTTNDFSVQLFPKLMGGGSCCSKSVPVGDEQQTQPPPMQATIVPSLSSSPSGDELFQPPYFSHVFISKETQQEPLPLEKLQHTSDLAFALCNRPDDAALEQLSLRIVEDYASKQNKTPALTQEVAALAASKSPEVLRGLFKVCVKEINHSEMLDVDILVCLKFTLQHMTPRMVDADDLIQVLPILFKRLSSLHTAGNTSPAKLFAILDNFCELLDLMGDSKVIDVKRIDLHDPVYTVLDSLSNHGSNMIAATAAYAKQSLIRLPNDENDFAGFLRRAIAAGKGIKSITDVVLQRDVSALLNAYDQFKEALTFKEVAFDWYAPMRVLRTMIDNRDWSGLDKFIKKEQKFYPEVARGVCACLQANLLDGGRSSSTATAASSSFTFVEQQGIVHLMAATFLHDRNWGFEEHAKKAAVEALVAAAGHSQENVRQEAKATIAKLQQHAVTDQQKAALESVPKDLNAIPAAAVAPIQGEPSTVLFLAAKSSNILTLSQKIDSLRSSRLHDEEIKKELETYIPVLATEELFNNNFVAVAAASKNTFDLDAAVTAFLANPEQKLFLLLGDSDSGKSTFQRWMEIKLWTNWKKGNPIPLFISLPAIQSPYSELIEHTLQQKGFSPDDIKELKANYEFVFLLDGYDELNTFQNLYKSNHLQEWKAHVVITCRSQYLAGHSTSYRSYFTPSSQPPPSSFAVADSSKKKIDSGLLFPQAAIAPFSSAQIDDYLRKYYADKWEQYRDSINQVPGLRDLLVSPFLLHITAHALPALLQKREAAASKAKTTTTTTTGAAGDPTKLRKIDLYDAYIDQWFEKSETKLIANEEWEKNSKQDLKQLFARLSADLADEMTQDGINAVDYRARANFYDNNSTQNRWSRFFDNPDASVVAGMKGVPIRRVGPETYAFLHKSLLEYFGAQSIFDSVMGIANQTQSPNKPEDMIPPDLMDPLQRPPTAADELKLNRKILIDEPAIVAFLAERASQNQSFNQALFRFVEQSKENAWVQVAAANSMTILNAAGFSFAGMDLSKAQIPGAYLEEANFEGAKLVETNLQNVFLRNSNIKVCDFTGANMRGVQFGVLPYIESGDNILCIAISPDGQWIASVGSDGEDMDGGVLRMYYSITCEETFEAQYTDSPITCVAFSPDSKFIASGSEDGSVRLWDSLSGEVLLTWKDAGLVAAICFSPDGTKIATGNATNKIVLWEMQSGKQVAQYEGHTHWVSSVAFSPNGKLIVSGSEDTSVRLWDVENKTELAKLEGHTARVCSVAFSPDGTKIASGSEDATVRVWDVEIKKELVKYVGHSGDVMSVAFTPDGKWIVSGGLSKCIHIWHVITGELMNKCEGHASEVASLAVSADGKWIASGSHDGALRFWEPHTPLKLFPKPIPCVSLQAKDAKIQEAQYLSDSNRRLLQQFGAIATELNTQMF